MMRNYTRFIPGDEIDDVAQWRFGAVDAASQRLAAQPRTGEPQADSVQTETIRQEGYAEGFAQGHALATLDAQRQIDEFVRNQETENARSFVKLFESAKAYLQSSEQVIANGVLALACELAKSVIRHEVLIDPLVAQPVIRDALGIIVGDGKSARVRLNPLDLANLQGPIDAEFPGFDLKLLGDAAVQRGGCVVESLGAVVDGTIEKRWMRAVATMGFDIPWEEPSHD